MTEIGNAIFNCDADKITLLLLILLICPILLIAQTIPTMKLLLNTITVALSFAGGIRKVSPKIDINSSICNLVH